MHLNSLHFIRDSFGFYPVMQRRFFKKISVVLSPADVDSFYPGVKLDKDADVVQCLDRKGQGQPFGVMVVCRRKRTGNSLQGWKVVGDFGGMVRHDRSYGESEDRDFEERWSLYVGQGAGEGHARVKYGCLSGRGEEKHRLSPSCTVTIILTIHIFILQNN